MKMLIAALTCFIFVTLGAQPATAEMGGGPNFGYDENGHPHSDLQKFRREHGHDNGQGQKHKTHR